jgi:hypothetical protein
MTKIFFILENFWREILILLLFVVCFISIRSCKTQQNLAQLNAHGADSAYHYATDVTLKNGEHIFRIKTLEATVHELRGGAVLSVMEISKLKEDKIEIANLSAIYRGQVEAQGNINIKGKDSIVYVTIGGELNPSTLKVFDYRGNWLSLREVYNPLNDSLSHKYLYRVEFSLTSYRKSQGLFKPSILLADISFTDPSLRIGEFQAVKVVEAPKRFYETRAFAIGIGFIGGVYVSTKLK